MNQLTKGAAGLLILCFLLAGCQGAGGKASQKGLAHMEAGNYTQALEEFSKAAGEDAKNPTYALYQGMALMGLERFEEAQECFRGVIEKKPELSEAYRARGISFFRQEKYSQAAADFEQVLQLAGIMPTETDYDSLHWLCETYYRNQEFEKAQDAYLRLLKLKQAGEADVPSINQVVMELAQEKEYEKAQELAKEAIPFAEGEARKALRWNQAVIMEKIEEEAAKKLLEEYCRDYPEDEEAAAELDAFGR